MNRTKRILSVLLALCLAAGLLAVPAHAAAAQPAQTSAPVVITDEEYASIRRQLLPLAPFQVAIGLTMSHANEVRYVLTGADPLANYWGERDRYAKALQARTAQSFGMQPGGTSAVTREQEKTADLKMQAAALALLKDKQYAKAAWDKSTPAQKKDILTKYFAQVQKILGTSAKPALAWEDLGGAGAMYDPLDNQIYVDKTSLSGAVDSLVDYSPWPVLLKAVLHETRHTYQFEATQDLNKHTVSLETRAWWAWNGITGHYIDGVSFLSDFAYVMQPIEYDAFRFSTMTMEYEGLEIDIAKAVYPMYAGSWN
ncbi:MAG: hypothetical protein LBJ11_00675 [Oscillospiraceae bacterium]|jgi:hypothetical protein|nr:hypothetical protein [Oscillospiraceae bacterium]